jgi:hypothetical protein
MFLAGLAFCLAGGCPGRQLILSGEGDADAGVFVMGMITERPSPTILPWPALPRE